MQADGDLVNIVCVVEFDGYEADLDELGLYKVDKNKVDVDEVGIEEDDLGAVGNSKDYVNKIGINEVD